MADKSGESLAGDVLRLCRGLRESAGRLGLSGAEQATLAEHLDLAEQAAMADPADRAVMESQVRAMRYLLVEVADGPIAAFMADAAARIIGDEIGRLFS